MLESYHKSITESTMKYSNCTTEWAATWTTRSPFLIYHQYETHLESNQRELQGRSNWYSIRFSDYSIHYRFVLLHFNQIKLHKPQK
jgi:hypothetical protein